MRRFTQIVFTLLILFTSGVAKVWAVGTNDIYIFPSDNGSISVGEVVTLTGGDFKVTLTAVPNSGYTIAAKDFSVLPADDPSQAPKRHTLGVASELEVSDESTATDRIFSFILPKKYAGAMVTAYFTNITPISISYISDITNPSGNYKLNSGFDASGSRTNNIGSSSNPFRGSIEGYIYDSGDNKGQIDVISLSAPLFDYVKDATIKNIVVEGTISGSGNVGAIAGNALGASRIYNCGVFGTITTLTDAEGKPVKDTEGNYQYTYGSTIDGNNNVGSIVGLLDGSSRVINCFSFAKIMSGSNKGGIVGYNNYFSESGDIQTMVMNCMFYGDIASGNTISPVYGGNTINNVNDVDNTKVGLNTYNYYRYESLYSKKKSITTGKYNCALAVKEQYLTRFEIYRQLLNSNRKLAAWYATGDAEKGKGKQNEMAKWVLDKSKAPYPILMSQAYYPSVVNYDEDKTYDATGAKVDRSSISVRSQGGYIEKENATQKLTINISLGSGAPTNAAIISDKSQITRKRIDKDTLNYNFNYDKVQLPYFSEVGTGNYGVDANNKSRVVTGWKITGFGGNGTEGTFSKTDAYGGYNFADRNCTNKDLYSVSGRVFSQGAYFDVPYGVTSINIEPFWGYAAYVSDPYYDIVYKTDYTTPKNVTDMGVQNNYNTSSKKGSISIGGSTQTVYTSVATAVSSLPGLPTGTTAEVYHYAVVLVGNMHLTAVPSNGDRPFTIMSADLDEDREPDYSLIYSHESRNKGAVSPIRFDFINVPGTAMAQKPNGASLFRNVSIFKPKGWFEITNTCQVSIVQFEYDNGGKSAAPVILLGGEFEQFVSTQSSAPTVTQYIHVGGNAWFKEFNNGTHSDGTNFTPHIPISATGGDYDKFYLSGAYKPDATVSADDAEGYISGGRFGEVAGAGQQQIDGDVHWQIYDADIRDFYGGGINSDKPITGNITVDIYNSHVKTYCGGPKFGDNDKTVTTNATGCTFGDYFGAGYGGIAYVRKRTQDAASLSFSDWISNYTDNRGNYYNGTSTKIGDSSKGEIAGPGVAVDFDYEFFVWSTGETGGRFYIKYASLSFATTNDVNSTLNNCHITHNFYGGGNLGKVDGNATSALNGCTVDGEVFGAGYSASRPKVPYRDGGFSGTAVPGIDTDAGVFTDGVKVTITDDDYLTLEPGKTLTNAQPALGSGTMYTNYTEAQLNSLGTVAGKVTLTIDNYAVNSTTTKETSITGNVYGGGESSDVYGVNSSSVVTSEVEVNIKGGSMVDVYGGGKGKTTVVGGDVTVNVGKLKDGSTNVYEGNATVTGSVYGGSALGVVNAKKDTDWDKETNPDDLIFIDGKETKVNILKGTVNGSVYGGGLGDLASLGTDHSDVAAKVYGDVTVTVGVATETAATTVPIIEGSVYGGSNVNGVLEKGARVDIISGTIGKETTTSNTTTLSGGNVHGGGYGQPTLVKGDVTVNVGVETNDTPAKHYGFATIKGDVYGGSAKGNVNAEWVTDNSTTPATETLQHAGSTETKVNLYGSQSVRDIYGGGLGELGNDPNSETDDTPANVYGNVTVKVYGGTARYVFGCNNIFGTPKGTVDVTVNGTNATTVDAQTSAKTYAIKGVYGGGNLAHYDPTTPSTYPTVTVSGCSTSIEDVFGGGNAAAVPYTSVTINGGDIKRVFAGGNGSGGAANVGYKNSEETPTAGEDEYGTGSANVTIAGGTINQVFGGSNSKGTVRTSGIFSIAKPTSGDNLCDMMIGEVYGGGNLAAGAASTITIGCTGSIVDGENGHEAHPENIGTTLEGIGAVYGGANEADVSGNISLSINSGIIANVFGGNNTSGDISGTITVNIEKNNATCGWYVGNVYGGGNLAVYTAPTATPNYPQVNILAGNVSGDVYGGGLGNVADASKGVVTGNPIVTLTNGSVRNIYGGGSAASIDGSTLVKVEGGSVTTDVYGGGEGSTTNVTGDVEVRIGKKIEGTGGAADTYEGTATVGGDVYGGSAFGKVNNATTPGTTSVNLYAGTITGKVFGGGKGKAPTAEVPATDTTPKIDEDPGVEAEVYGATTVKLYGDVVTGGIYGGCNLNGTMKGNTQLDLLGGTVGVSGLSTTPDIVFGGGLGPDTKVDGNVTVNIGDADNAGTTIYSNVYGGSAKGTVNSSTSNTTTVNLFKGTIYGNVFGGGLGDADNAAGVKGNVLVKLNENDGICVVTGSIFGCNNTNGSPEGDVEVHIYKTVGIDPNVRSTDKNNTTYDLAAVYGGGNKASYTASGKTAKVFIETCDVSVNEVYGGGYGADVPNTLVEVKGAYEIGTVFGGGYGASTTEFTNPGANVNGKTEVFPKGGTIHETYGGSNTKGNITGGTNVKVSNDGDCTLDVGKVYGGGKNAKMEGSANVVLGCQPDGIIEEVYGGAEAADIDGNVELTITSGHYRNVFGGNKTSGVIKGSIRLNIEETNADCGTPLIIDHLYGCGNQAPYSVYGYYQEGTIWKPRTETLYNQMTAAQKTAEGLPYADPEVHIVSFTKIGQIFGGGLGEDAKVYGNPKVYINQRPNYKTENDATANADKHVLGAIGPFTYTDGTGNVSVTGGVYGGGSEANVYGNTTVFIGSTNEVEMRSLPMVSSAYPKKYVEGANINCSVYGGGRLADVSGNTEVIIGANKVKSSDTYTYPVTTFTGSSETEVAKYKGILITGDVFGAGQGVDTDVTKALVSGNSTIVMKGGTVKKSVYGGGELSQLAGNTNITVSAGTIGTPAADLPSGVTAGAIYGNVYGGGFGTADATITNYKLFGLVKGNTNVAISGGDILHNVYGGGAYGSVGDFTYDETATGKGMPTGRTANTTGGATYVTITGGTIGTTGEENGMVFGSSRGDVEKLGTDGIDPNDRLAWVYDTHVTIGTEGSETGPQINGSLYGSGENGHTWNDTEVIVHSGTIGIASGGTITDDKGTTDTSDDKTYSGAEYPYRGNVYGGGCGTDKYDSDGDNVKDAYNSLAGIVRGDATINITGGRVVHNVYGAGAMGSVGTANTGGQTTILISNGTIGVDGSAGEGNVFGAARGALDAPNNNFAVVSNITSVSITGGTVYGSVYGGGELGYVGIFTSEDNATTHSKEYTWTKGGTCNVTINGGTASIKGNVFGAGKGSDETYECEPAMVYKTFVTVKDGTIDGTVYGGGQIARVENDTEVTIGTAGETGETNKPDIKGNVFAAGKGLNTHGYSALVRGNSKVTVQGKAHVGHSVFGGGEIATVGRYVVVDNLPTTNTSGGDCTVEIKDNAHIAEDVYGAGKGVLPYEGYTSSETPWSKTSTGITQYTDNNKDAYFKYITTLAIVSDTHVTVTGSATVDGSVYGGGQKGFVQTDTDVKIQGSCTIGTTAAGGNVFGGGLGDASVAGFAEAGRVKGNTNLEVSGGNVYGNVYGGGSLGDVGTIVKSADYNYKWTNETNPGETYTYNNTGLCTVVINDGIIGIENPTKASEHGNVFGAGKGKNDTYWCEKAMVYKTNVTINKGTVYGNVYGGGQIGRVENNAVITIGPASGNDVADIKGDVFGAGAGLNTHGYSALVRGNATVTVQGKAQVGQSVYGGGETASVGRFVVNTETSLPTEPLSGGTCTVTVNGEAAITGNVYGACKGVEPANYTTAKHWTNDNAEHGFDNREKYLEYLTTLALTSNTDVAIGGSATIGGSVFGGGQRGITLGYVEVDVIGGTVNNDVYGGGALADTNTSNWDGSTLTVKYYEVTGLTVGTSVVTGLYTKNGDNYSEITTADEKAASGTTYYRLTDTRVNLYGGLIKGDAYGGGLGQLGNDPIEAKVYGNVAVNLGNADRTTATAFYVDKYTEGTHAGIVKSGRVFGCNNLNGSPQGRVTVTVNHTVKGNTEKTDKDDWNSEDATKHSYHVAAVYGGGNLAGKTVGGSTYVIINGCDVSIRDVYGGGNAAEVPATDVLINGAYEIEEVFGGGNGKDDYTLDGGANWTPNPGANVNGNTNTLLLGGLIHEAYGGSNQKGTITGNVNINTDEVQPTDCSTCPLDVEKIVGAGKNADVEGDLIMVLGCKPTTKTSLIFAGADNADVNGNVELTITSGTFGQVFGGNNLGGAIKGHIKLNIEETGCNPIRIDELYLGGKQAAYSRYGYYEDTSDNNKVKPRTAAMHAIAEGQTGYVAPLTNPSNTDQKHPFPYAQPELNVISCTSIGKVFGGGLGEGAVMHADPTVNINMIPGAFASQLGAAHALGAIGDVFGGGNAADVYGDATVNIGTATTVTLTSVTDDQSTAEVNESLKTVEGANITGDVFGGGYSADVKGNTQVNICAVKSGDTYTGVTIAGTDYHGVKILGSVYGGGDLGSVGTFTYANTANNGKNPGADIAAGKPTGFTANTGKSVVAIMGNAEIGLDNMKMYHSEITDGTDKPDDKGHVFGAGKGKLEAPSATSNVELTSYVDNTVVTIGGNAFVKGSVYGGSENGHVLHDTYVNIQGGQIGCGKNTTARHPDDVWADTYTANETTELWSPSWEYKSPFAPFDPNANASGELGQYSNDHSTEGGRKIASDGHTYYGNVFGGGSGSVPYFDETAGISKYLSTAGSVEGDTHVTISGGHILTSVYGGCETTNVKGTANVTMTGGTIGVPRTDAQIIAHPVTGYLFGAGKGDQRVYFNKETNVNDAVVKVEGGRIYGSVYGGGEDGHVLRNVEVTIGKADHTGPTIGTKGTSYYDGHVFGGGRGFGGEALTAGNVGGAVTLNIESGSVLGSVYGGGRLASVGYGLYLTTEDGYGEMRADDEYDGSYTNPSTEEAGTFFNKGRGHITVNVNGGTIGNENASGDGAKYSGNVFGGSMGRLNLLDGTTRSDIWPLMAQVKSTAVNIYGDAVIRRNVFGGGELGVVRDDAYVTIGGYKTANADADGNVAVTASGSPTVRRDVFGGGYGSEDKQHTIISVKESGTNNTYAYTPMQFAGCVGKNTYVNVVGGYVRKSVYGGGEMASVGVIDYSTKEVDNSAVTSADVVVSQGTSKSVVYSNMVKHDDVNTEFALSWPYKFNYVNGFIGATHVKVTGGRLGLKDDDTDTGFEDNGDVYGAGKGKAGDFKDYLFCANVGSTDVVLDHSSSNALTAYSGTADLIAGAVYGGGEDGHVMGDAKVTMKKGFVYHSLYGAGSGKGRITRKLLKSGKTHGSTNDSDYETRETYSITAGKVFGNSTVEMSGGMVVRNVYGGGNMGSVGKGNYAGGTDDYSTKGYGEKVANLWSNTDFKNSGKCTVKISGGTIGFIDTSDPSNTMYPWNSTASLPYGNVFGGCRGEAVPNITDSPRYYYCPEFFVGYANETSVTIEGDNTKILGSVYGGGMDGHVRRDASVIIKGGEIGLPFTAANKTLVGTTDPDNIQWLARGNVYGAGSGIGKYNDEFCTSAGSVTRFTTVSIQGGTIHRNLYGGGSLASIGAPKIPANSTTNPTKAQTLNKVTISGGQIGGDYSYTSGTHVYGGHVFGGSRGDASLRNSALSFSTSMFTEVNVEAGANIYGSVFGGGEVGIVRGDVAVAINGGTIHDDVYGGGALADTNTETSSTVPYTTTVNLIGGSIGGDAYGGGLGQLEPAIEAMVHGNVHVTLGNETEDETKASATKFNISYLTDNSVEGKPAQVVKSGRVFGCNNLNGSPKGDVTVTVNRTAKVKNGNGDVISRTAITRDATTNEITAVATPHIYEVAAVYGGGNLADYTAAGKKARVEVMTCDVSIEEVYGGGNAAKVPATDVEVKGAHQIERVFGGGNGKDKYTLDGGTSWMVNPGADIDGDAYTIIKGGLIHEAYGGSNEKGTITGNITINTATGGCEGCPTQIDKLVGAGKNADVNGDLIMVLGCKPTTKTPLVFAGADNADVNGNVELTITSGTFGQVFGGNNLGGVIRGHITLNIEETGCNPIKIEELYLGGNQAAYSVYGYNADGTCITSGTTKAYADPILNVVSCTSIDKVFGGGLGTGAVMYADPTVNINMIPGAFASDGTKGVPAVMTAKGLSLGDNPNNLGIIGNVYGGGNAADVIGNPTVNIGTASTVKLHQSYNATTKEYTFSNDKEVKGAYIIGNVFGGGMGKDDTFTCEKAMVGIDGDGVANPNGGTTVNIYKGTVLGSVYGGGEVGRVEKNTAVTIGTGDGVATGTPTSAPVIKGSVFGGGKGLETHGYSALVRGNPTVTVQGNAKVRGNVYGGGQIASVARYNVAQTDDEGAPYGVKKDEPYALKTNTSGFCTVTIKGYAEIGPETIGEEKTTSVGHVFGAGKGILPGGTYAFVQGTTKRMVSVKNEQGQITGSTWDVFANEADYITFVKTLALSSQTNVTIDGNAKVKGSVFGGSESGFVQFDANVNVLGGTIGIQGKGGADFGNVYGGGKGDVEYTGANHDYITAGIVKGNTKVVISQAEGKTTKILHNVYGGGAYGTVGEFEYDDTGMPTARKTYQVGTEVHNTTGGKAEIYITGGTIGTNGNENGMIFGSSRGDVGAPGSIHDKAAWVYDTHVAIGDTIATTTTTATPLIKGSIYGGGENGHNLHNAYVRINGGTIGIPEGELIGSYTGASYPYRGNVYGGGCGTDKYDNDTKYNPLAGIVRGNVIINMTAGHVVHNMYGAGAMGSVGKKVVSAGVTTITGGTTTININGGTLGVNDDSDEDGNVFGAARGATDATGSDLAMVFANANVSVSGGTVYGSVFGGGQRGVTLGSVAVNMTGGSVSKDVYGGGALADTNTGNVTGYGTSTESISSTSTYTTIVNLLGGTIGGDAYGGGLGQLEVKTGETVTTPAIEAKVYGDTKVNLNGLEVGDYVEGIHKSLTEGTTAKLVSIVDANNSVTEYQINDAVQGAVVNRIFGCNNLNGSPQGKIKVHVFKTQRAGQTRITNAGNVTTAKVKVEPTDGDYNLKSFDVEAVYGGGNMAAYVPADLTTGKTLVIIDGCDRTSIGQVYGGGNAASTPATDVTVNGSFEIAEVFGGGNGKDKITINNVEKDNPGANVGFYDYSAEETTYNTKDKRQDDAFTSKYVYGSGKAAVNIYGGTIHRVFGGSNTKGNVRQSAITMLEDAEVCAFCVDEAYGGGKSAPMDAEAKLLMACIPGLKEAYGGAEAADVYDDVSVTITNGTFDRVFGGNNLSGTIRGKITVTVEETGCRPVIIGELYGGGNQAGYSVYGYDSNGNVKESGENPLYADPQVNVRSFTSIGNIYGGGYGAGATMVGNPTVNINVAEGDKKDYTYENDKSTYKNANNETVPYYDANGFKELILTVDGHEVTLPNHKAGTIGAINNVFGGGNAAKVIGNTNVKIGTEVGNDVYMEVVVPKGTTSVTGCYTRLGAGTTASPYTYTAATGAPVDGTTYYKKYTIKGADIRGNVYGGGNNAEVTGNTNVQIGKENTTTNTTTTP